MQSEEIDHKFVLDEDHGTQDGNVVSSFKIDECLTDLQKVHLDAVMSQFADIFSSVPGRTNLVTHDIKVKDERPIRKGLSKSHSLPKTK